MKMTESLEPEEHSRLVRLIRKIAREEAIEAIDSTSMTTNTKKHPTQISANRLTPMPL
jgi:hypothetical protein